MRGRGGYMNNVIVITIVMVDAGVIGAYCRFIFDKNDRNIDNLYNRNGGNPYIGAGRRFLIQSIELIIPGIVASFIVPLFLSIGRSTLFTDLVKGNEDFYVNLFILFAFCLLASVSAKSFVNALAQQALKTADEAKKEAVEAKDLSAEAIEAKISVEERGDKANFNIETADSINNYDGTNEERIVLSSLLNGEYVRR